MGWNKIFGLLLILIVFNSCAPLKPVVVRDVAEFKTEEILTKPRIIFNLKVFNPNPYGLTVKRMGVMVKVSDSTLANVNLLQGVRIGANSEVTVPVTIQPSLSTLGNIFMAGVNSFLSRKDQKVTIEGDIIVKKFIFSKRFAIKESLKFQ